MYNEEAVKDRTAVLGVAGLIIVSAMAFLMARHMTYVHIDAIAHVNKARGLFDNFTPGLGQLGSIWLPLPHLLMAPLTWFDSLWTTGAAGSLVSAACFVGTSWYLFSTTYAWIGVRAAAWLAFLLFALNPRLIYLFTTPMTEPLMILCAAGLTCYLVRWSQTQEWKPFGLACLMALAGTLTRYEGWTIAGAAILLVALLARAQRAAATILFAGAAATGPMLWMVFNMVYFDDPLFFTYGRGSARDYAMEHFFRTGRSFATAGSWMESFGTYFVSVAYCLNSTVLWLGIGGMLYIWTRGTREWRSAVVPFGFYVYNLYTNTIPILMPDLIASEAESIYNVRYGAVMAAAIPILAASFLDLILRQVHHHRAYSLLLLLPLLLPDPVPAASLERPDLQLTQNLFYVEAIHNQSFWLPPFIEVAKRLQSEIEHTKDETSLILTNSRVVHPVVWATAIPMRRFIHELNKHRWEQNLNVIDPGIRWVITEEGDQLWHAQSKFLQRDFVDVVQAKAASSGVVHLYRRR
jgi:hypothetical protein